MMRARPRNTASCRGDAPGSVIIDEIAFIESKFFEEFVRPLTQVGGRAFSFITTPPPRDSWFSAYLKPVSAPTSAVTFTFILFRTRSCAPSAQRMAFRKVLAQPWPCHPEVAHHAHAMLPLCRSAARNVSDGSARVLSGKTDSTLIRALWMPSSNGRGHRRR